MSEYTEQAEDFMKNTGTKIKIDYLKYDYHFVDDKEMRDIYRITLSRNGERMSFNFGQSISNRGIEPNAYDVLACLTKYDPDSFEEFCHEFGYDTDSRKAEKIYKAVCKEWNSVNRLFSDVLNELQDIN